MRKAADVAESDLVQDCAAEVLVDFPGGEQVADNEVSSMIARIISDYIPSEWVT